MEILTLDTSCVVNLLESSEAPDESLLRLLRLGFRGKIQLYVTPIVEHEVYDGRSTIFERLLQFPILEVSADRLQERDHLANQLLNRLWPNSVPGSRSREHARLDCQHIASHQLCGGSIFITKDEALIRKLQARSEDLAIRALTPSAALQPFQELEPATDESWRRNILIRPARPDDASEIASLMAPIRHLYPAFERWRATALHSKRAYVGVIEGQVAGISVWSEKSEGVVKLSTFFVTDTERGHSLGPNLLFHQIRTWIDHKIRKVFVTVAADHFEQLSFFIDFGFRVEGFSPRRYRDDLPEIVMAKHFFYRRLGTADLPRFVSELDESLFSLSRFPVLNTSKAWLLPPGSEPHRAADLPLDELETIVYPARFALDDRPAFVIPIQPRWADRMMRIDRPQQTLFTRADKIFLRTDNVYYCYPRYDLTVLTGAPVLFYVSAPDMMVAGHAKILEAAVSTPEDLFLRFGDLGTYGLREIAAHEKRSGSQKGQAMALRFGWWVQLPKPVYKGSLAKRSLHPPQTITRIPYATYEQILLDGGVSW